jgi:short-subunit dehydrogenase
MSDFNGKTIWVTGASSGIGRAFVEFVDVNFDTKFILSSRNESELIALNRTLKNPENNSVIPINLEFPESIEKAIEQIKEKAIKIDFLFNNGGVSQRSEALETDIAVDRKMFEINYFGNIYLTKLIAPWMIEKGGGHIIVTSSIAGKFGFFLRSAYSASKHALHGFYEAFRLEVEKENIQVTIVCPGKINTPISKSALRGDGSSHGKMDHNQETGMPAEECARQIVKAVERNKKEVLIGNKELLAVKLRRILPQNLFWNLLKKQSPT